MFKKLFFSFTLVLVLLAILSQPVFAEEEYQIKEFITCGDNIGPGLHGMVADVNKDAKKWLNSADALHVKIVSHSLSFFPIRGDMATCTVLSILYTYYTPKKNDASHLVMILCF